jgi:hypothetical protein
MRAAALVTAHAALGDGLLRLAGEAVRDDHRTLPALAAMLYTALQTGMPPARIRAVIPTRAKSPIPGTSLSERQPAGPATHAAARRPSGPSNFL